MKLTSSNSSFMAFQVFGLSRNIFNPTPAFFVLQLPKFDDILLWVFNLGDLWCLSYRPAYWTCLCMAILSHPPTRKPSLKVFFNFPCTRSRSWLVPETGAWKPSCSTQVYAAADYLHALSIILHSNSAFCYCLAYIRQWHFWIPIMILKQTNTCSYTVFWEQISHNFPVALKLPKHCYHPLILLPETL